MATGCWWITLNKRLYEMGYTPMEFRKALFGQFDSNTNFTIKEIGVDAWSIEDANEAIDIEVRIAVGKPRKIALLTLPVLNTEFDFKQLNSSQEKAFMKTFFKYFHKGGG